MGRSVAAVRHAASGSAIAACVVAAGYVPEVAAAVPLFLVCGTLRKVNASPPRSRLPLHVVGLGFMLLGCGVSLLHQIAQTGTVHPSQITNTAYFLLVLGIGVIGSRRQLSPGVLAGLCLVLGVAALTVFVDFLRLYPDFGLLSRGDGVFGRSDFVVAGSILALAAAACIGRVGLRTEGSGQGTLFLVFTGIISVGVIASGSREAMLAVAAAAGFAVLARTKRAPGRGGRGRGVRWIAIAGLVVISIFLGQRVSERNTAIGPDDVSRINRLALWQESVEVDVIYLLLGSGFGRFSDVIVESESGELLVGRAGEARLAHNAVLSSAVMLGLAGLAGSLLFLVGVAQRSRETGAALFVLCLLGDPLFYAGPLLLATVLASYKGKQSEALTISNADEPDRRRSARVSSRSYQ